MDKQIVISIKTVLFTVSLLFAGYVVVRLGPVIGMVIISLLIVISIESVIKRIRKVTFFNRPVSRSFAVIISYTLLILLFLGILTSGLQPVLEQIRKLFIVISELFVKYNIEENLASLDVSLKSLIPNIPSTSGGVLNTLTAIFSNFVNIISIFIISIYTSLDWENLKEKFYALFSGTLRDKVEEAVCEIEEKIGHWVKGQLILMLSVGVLSFVGLVILGVDYPLALGIIAGMLEFIPMFGPFIAAVVAGFVGFSTSLTMGLAVMVWFLIVQEIENTLLVPKIMQKASGFSPLFVLLAILAGGEFFGIVGVILAVPLSMIGVIILKKVLKNPGS